MTSRNIRFDINIGKKELLELLRTVNPATLNDVQLEEYIEDLWDVRDDVRVDLDSDFRIRMGRAIDARFEQAENINRIRKNRKFLRSSLNHGI